jgi:hypothetical protein
LSGDDRPIGLVALSSLNENPGGDEVRDPQIGCGDPGLPRTERQPAVKQSNGLVVGIESGDDAADVCRRAG